MKDNFLYFPMVFYIFMVAGRLTSSTHVLCGEALTVTLYTP